LNFVSASLCSDKDDNRRPHGAICENIWDSWFNCRANPVSDCRSQWCPRVDKSQWFNNNSYIENSVSASWMDEAELSAYKKFKNYFGLQWLWSSENVRKIQETINILHQKMTNCWPVCEDWRFWNDTISKLQNCLPCNGDKENWAKLDATKGLKCEDWYSIDDQFCCTKIQDECLAPEVTIDWNKDVTNYTNTELDVKLDYSSNDWDIKFNEDSIEKDGCEYGDDLSITNKVVTLKVIPHKDNNKLLLNFTKDFAILTWWSWWYNCPPISINLTRCDTPLSWWSCKTYWTWYFDKDNCCIKCGNNEKPDWGGNCVCDEAALDCASKKEKKANNACKCVCDPAQQCCWIKLNTVVPFIGDCIEMTTVNDTHDSNNLNTSNVNQLNAFPFLMMWLSKILVTVILIFSFLIVIAAGLMMVTWVYDEWNYKKWMTRIKNVIVALILLWSSGLILKLINPSFFWG